MIDINDSWVSLQGKPQKVDEWRKEDQLNAVLDNSQHMMSKQEAEKALSENIIRLPGSIIWKNLRGYAQAQQTPLKLEIPPELDKYDYLLVEVPVNVLMPGVSTGAFATELGIRARSGFQ